MTDTDYREPRPERQAMCVPERDFNSSGVKYEPWIGPNGEVGYRMTRAGTVEYLYFNPSDDMGDGGPDGGPGANVFVYQGEAGDPSIDGSLNFYYVLEGADFSGQADE